MLRKSAPFRAGTRAARSLRVPHALALLLSLSLPAQAADKARAAKAAEADARTAEAREHLEKAKIHYRLREFKEAVEEFRAAYRLKPVPALLFNIAQAERMVGALEESKFHYEQYLQEVPDAGNRADVEEQIGQLVKLLEERAHAAPAPVLTPAMPAEKRENTAPPPAVVTAAPAEIPAQLAPPEPKTEPARVAAAAVAPAQSTSVAPPAKSGHVLSWVLAGGAALGGITGAVLGWKAQSLRAGDLITTGDSGVQRHSITYKRAAESNNYALGANVAWAAGAACAVGAGVTFFLESTPDGAAGGLSLQGTY